MRGARFNQSRRKQKWGWRVVVGVKDIHIWWTASSSHCQLSNYFQLLSTVNWTCRVCRNICGFFFVFFSSKCSFIFLNQSQSQGKSRWFGVDRSWVWLSGNSGERNEPDSRTKRNVFPRRRGSQGVVCLSTVVVSSESKSFFFFCLSPTTKAAESWQSCTPCLKTFTLDSNWIFLWCCRTKC